MISVYVDPVKNDALRRLGIASGRPMAEHIREAIDDLLAKYKVPVKQPKAKR